MFTFFVGKGGLPIIFLQISVDTTNYDMFAAAGSPSYPVQIRLTIDNAVVLGSTSTSTPSLTTSTGWATGSELLIINNGTIAGQGGNGGAGGNATDTFSCNNGSAGTIGGDAIEMLYDLTIDNANGNVFGGGGGGGGGGGASTYTPPSYVMGGGGGGGAQSDTATTGGGGGIASDDVDINVNGNAGSAGSFASNGTGGTGGSGGAGGQGGTGGDGGTWGVNGGAGANGAGSRTACSGGGGGTAGKAIELTGNVITWLAGNNASQVKGDVT